MIAHHHPKLRFQTGIYRTVWRIEKANKTEEQQIVSASPAEGEAAHKQYKAGGGDLNRITSSFLSERLEGE